MAPADKTRVPTLVVADKTGVAYQVHSYPTKIPPDAIRPFLAAYTQPGDVVLDPFCGSGMTGVAATRLGRKAVLSDLSPGAVHLARNHTHTMDPQRLIDAMAELEARWMARRERDLYTCNCPTCGSPALARHTIWSETATCPSCFLEVTLWDLREERGQIPRRIRCSRCGEEMDRAGTEPSATRAVQVTADCQGDCSTLQTGDVQERLRSFLADIASRRQRHWVPDTPVAADREMYHRSALHLKGISTVGDFFLPRSKMALAGLWAAIDRLEDEHAKAPLRLAFTNSAWHCSRMRRYNEHGGQRPLTGTLYIPQLTAESNVFEIFRNQVRQIVRYYEEGATGPRFEANIRKSSATDLSWLDDHSVDYVFTDPPFGANLFYGDCNVVWEAWLGDVTETENEIVVNRCLKPGDGGKTIDDYERLLAEAFKEIRRVLKPDGRASVVFHNSDDQVWKAMLEAAESAGLRQVEVSVLDKVQRSMKGYKGRSGRELVPFFDLVITFAPGPAVIPKLNGAGEIALETVVDHLRDLRQGSDNGQGDKYRSLEYLYSLSLAEIVRTGARPDGLSLRAFESLCDRHLFRDGAHYLLPS